MRPIREPARIRKHKKKKTGQKEGKNTGKKENLSNLEGGIFWGWGKEK